MSQSEMQQRGETVPNRDEKSKDLELARQGDFHALGRVVLAERGMVLAAARRYVRGARRPDLTEDLVAAAIAGSSRGVGGLMAAVGSWDPDLGAWEPYAYSRCLHAARSELNYQLGHDTRAVELTEELEPVAGSEDTIIDQLDLVAGARRCSPRQREVIEQLATGSSPADVAADLGITESCVRSHLGTARARIRG